jgi:hypothetical protein
MALINILRTHFDSKLNKNEFYVKKKDIKDIYYRENTSLGNLNSTWSQLVRLGYLSKTCNPMIYKILKRIPDDINSSRARRKYDLIDKSIPL